MRGNSQPAESCVSTPDQDFLLPQLLSNNFQVFCRETNITGALEYKKN
jgi:hypothetical protein